MTQGDVFAAIADPTRRRILELVSRGTAGTPTELATELSISRQAVSKHLGLLTAAGLTAAHRAGRQTRFRADPHALRDVTAWVASVESDWRQRLELLAGSLDRLAQPVEPATDATPTSERPRG